MSENSQNEGMANLITESTKSIMKVLMVMYICHLVLMFGMAVLIIVLFTISGGVQNTILDQQAVIEAKLDNQNALLVELAVELAKARIEADEAQIADKEAEIGRIEEENFGINVGEGE